MVALRVVSAANDMGSLFEWWAEIKVIIDTGLAVKSGISEEFIALQQAEPDMIKTIAYLLAQTVALHFYEMCVHPQNS
jgi:hypothetical protein